MRPDYRRFYGSAVLSHSAEGSTWKNHKYIKRVDGTYYYPEGYKNGRTIDELKEKEGEQPDESAYENFSDADIDALVQEVIHGNFGNGEVRKEALGENYQRVQDKVNELLLGKSGSQKISSKASSGEKKKEIKSKDYGKQFDAQVEAYKKEKKKYRQVPVAGRNINVR